MKYQFVKKSMMSVSLCLALCACSAVSEPTVTESATVTEGMEQVTEPADSAQAEIQTENQNDIAADAEESEIPKKVVDGIVHNSYSSVELGEVTSKWINDLIAACEAGDHEKAAMLTGFDSQYQDELQKIIQELNEMEGSITEASESEYYRFLFDKYKCCVRISEPNRREVVYATVYLLTENGMGYVARSSMGFTASHGVETTYNPNWAVYEVPCINGMYEGDYTGDGYWYYRRWEDDSLEHSNAHVYSGTVKNGLYDGEVVKKTESSTSKSVYENGTGISGVKILANGQEEALEYQEGYLYYLHGSAEPVKTDEGLVVYPY